MSRTQAPSLDKNFVQGRISQATGLNFPENACIDESNCVFDERGFVRRRFGVDFEAGFSTKTIDRSNNAINTYLWRNAAGDGTLDIAVVQVGTTLYFYTTPNAALSIGALVTTVDMTLFTPTEGAGGTIGSNECQFATGLSYLFVWHPYLDTFYVSYDKVSQLVSANRITVQIRDFDGLNDGLTVDNRPNVLTATHNYNLLNQGWDATKITSWNASQSNFPSNVDVWWLYRNAVTDSFDPTVQLDFNRGNTPAPQGHYILTAFNQDRSATSGLAVGATVTTSGIRPSVGTFYAGRVFYAGVNSATWNTKILFSQIIEKTTDFGKCYQSLDPTSESLFDLEPSDGGIINIPEAGNIYKLLAYGDYLLVFGYNGVWAIAGNSGVGFTASDYTVSLVANIRTVSSSNFVVVDGVPTWWNLNGIYSVNISQDGKLLVQSLTDKTIKEFFKSIPFLSKRQARGAYNQISHTVQWVYRSTAASDPTNIYDYDSVLNLNTLTGAFYTWSFTRPTTTNSPRINGIISLDTGGNFNLSESPVIDAAVDSVLDASGRTVVTFGLGGLGTATSTSVITKFLVSYASGATYVFSFAESSSLNGYTDWTTAAGASQHYTSYFITGYKTPTSGMNRFQTNYLFTFSDAPAAGKFGVEAMWDFANAGTSGKWSNRQLINITPTNYDFKRNKLLIRGNGHSLALKFTSVDDTGFSLAGWGMFNSGSNTP